MSTLLLCILLLAQPHITESMDAIEVQKAIRSHLIQESSPMAPRRPSFSAVDISVDGSNNRIYDGGADLRKIASTATVRGDMSIGTFITSQSGVKIEFYSNSWFQSGAGFMPQGITRTWPVTWSSMYISPAPTNTGQTQAHADIGSPSSPDTQLKYQGSQWTDPTQVVTSHTSNPSKDLDDIYTAEGIDPSDLHARHGVFVQPSGSVTGYFAACGIRNNADWHYNTENWQSDDGVRIRTIICIIAGGNTTMRTNVRFDQQYTNSGGSTATATKTYTNILTDPDCVRVDLPNSNGAKLVYIPGPEVVNYTSASATLPQAFLRNNGGAYTNGQVCIVADAQIQRMVSAGVQEDNISICTINDAASMNMAAFTHGAVVTGRNTFGSTHAVREGRRAAMGSPTVLFALFGHNNLVSTGTNYKAESAAQADFFDGLLAKCNDHMATSGDWPMVVLVLPQYAAGFDQDRHDEWVGAAADLREYVPSVLELDLFNRVGGTSFDGTVGSSDPADWYTAITFKTDSGGTGAHPLDDDATNQVGSMFWNMLEEAAALDAEQQRSSYLVPYLMLQQQQQRKKKGTRRR